jgi:hypothetical protein
MLMEILFFPIDEKGEAGTESIFGQLARRVSA